MNYFETKEKPMRRTSKFSMLLLFFALMVLGSCSTTKESDPLVQDELKDFRDWVNTQTNTVAERTSQDWKRSKEDFQMRTAELDRKQENFSEEVREEYQTLKDNFNRLAEKEASRPAQEAALPEWEERLLSTYSDYSTITKQNVRDVYIYFMENVRTQHTNWSNDDWDMAKLVLEKLNTRKDAIDDGLETDAEVKIKALEMEFRTLENGADLSGN